MIIKNKKLFVFIAAVDAFKPDSVSETILRRLLSQDVVHHIKIKAREKNNQSLLIYEQGKPADYFVLIVEGRVEVTVGQENLLFECGPFTYFGTQALVQSVGVGKIRKYAQQINNGNAAIAECCAEWQCDTFHTVCGFRYRCVCHCRILLLTCLKAWPFNLCNAL